MQKDVLENGVRVLTEYMPYVRSVSSGIWVDVGAAHEKAQVGGVSHFLEHMLFKGTEKRSAKEIAEAFDDIGAHANAFTSKEHTCYYTRCLDENFAFSLDILFDMYLNSVFEKKEFEREKDVILEEISMYEDTPDDLAQELFNSTLWHGHAYGLPTIGTRETVNDLTNEKLRDYYRQAYAPASTIIAVAGNIPREKVLEEVTKHFGTFQGNRQVETYGEPVARTANAFIYKDIEQMHVCLGCPAIKETDDDYYAATILNIALGGGAGSRLFQEAREKRGFCYSVYSFLSAYAESGYLAAYASTNPKKLVELIKVIMAEIGGIKEKGLLDSEIERAKQQLKSGLLMSMENSGNVMNRLGKMEIAYGRLLSIEEIVEKVMKVESKDIIRVAKRIFGKDKFTLALVGPEEKQFDLSGML